MASTGDSLPVLKRQANRRIEMRDTTATFITYAEEDLKCIRDWAIRDEPLDEMDELYFELVTNFGRELLDSITSRFTKCCFCNKLLDDADVNNAEPLVANGKCCYECNSERVIPARLKQWKKY